MASLLPLIASLVLALLPQDPPRAPNGTAAPAKPPAKSPAPAPAKPSTGGAPQVVQYDDSNGWPIVPGDLQAPSPLPAPAAPMGEAAMPRRDKERAARPVAPAAAGEAATGRGAARRVTPEARNELASGMQMGSALLDVFQATRSPGAFKELGGVVVTWRLTTHGPRGEVIGTREVTQTADCAFAERDRLEFTDGRVYGRIGAQVYAERQNLPAPTMVDLAQQELTLFGMQLRMPWVFADARAFAVLARDVDDRDGERLARIVVERRPPPALDLLGPEPDPAPRDRYEICFEPSTGLPREFVHRFAASKQSRRVVLEDWRDFETVRLPWRRAYVDDGMRVTTLLEILDIKRQRVTERDFRLH